MTEHHCDVVVVGMGTCGEDVSLRLAGAGLDVVGIEPNLIGGECPFWACLPSKWMARNAQLLTEARRADGLVGSVNVEPDWGLIAQGLRAEVTGPWDDSGGVARFEAKGGTFVRGWGELVGPRRVAVDGDVYSARLGVVVATGSVPIVPPIPGLSDGPFWTHRDAIAAESLPESLVILGGGVIAVEIGQIYATFGCQVTIVEMADRLLANEEPETSDLIRQRLESSGVTVLLGQPAVGVAYDDGVEVELGDGTKVGSDRLLVAVGRRPAGDSIGADRAGASVSRGVIEVDAKLRAADGFWAIGDVTGVSLLTSVAEYQARIAVEDVLGADPDPARYDAIPRTIFTDPEIGAVGMTEAQAKEQGFDVDVVVKNLQATFRGWLHRVGNEGLIKLVSADGRLVGATFVGPHATDVVGFLSLAVSERVPLANLVDSVYGFPSFYGAIGEALGAYGRGIVRVLDPETAPLIDDPDPRI